jgi:hypothetical protein
LGLRAQVQEATLHRDAAAIALDQLNTPLDVLFEHTDPESIARARALLSDTRRAVDAALAALNHPEGSTP